MTTETAEVQVVAPVVTAEKPKVAKKAKVADKSVTKAKATKTAVKIAKAVKPTAKPEVKGYKDNYSTKVYETQTAFLETKLKRATSKFTKLYAHLLPLVKKQAKEIAIDIVGIGMDYVDARLPRYVLGFIDGGENYFVRNPKLKEVQKNDNSGGKTTGLIGCDLIKK